VTGVQTCALPILKALNGRNAIRYTITPVFDEGHIVQKTL